MSTFAALVAACTLGALPVPYGGTLDALAWQSGPSVESYRLTTAADLLVAPAVYQTLYQRTDGRSEPLLASGGPRVEGNRLTIPIREDVSLHEERLMLAQDVVRSLESLAKPGHPGAALIIALRGGRAALTGRAGRDGAALSIRALGDGRTLELILAEPYGPIMRLLSSPYASVHGLSIRPNEPTSGTGPFRLRGDTLTHAANYWGARPFVDAVRWHSVATRFGARAELRKRDAVITAGVPGLDGGSEQSQGALLGYEWLVLSVGPSLPRDLVGVIDGAVGRGRLVERFLPPDYEAKRRFVPGPEPTRASPTGERTVRLMFNEAMNPGRRFIERLQLDLLRKGVRVIAEAVSPSSIDDARARGEHELILEQVVVPSPQSPDSIDALHELLFLGGRAGALPALIAPGALAAYKAAEEDIRRETLQRLDDQLRNEIGFLAVARRAIRAHARGRVEAESEDLRNLANMLLVPEAVSREPAPR